jgi:hypothetical protein
MKRAYGAELGILLSAEGEITPDLIPRATGRARSPPVCYTNKIHDRDSLTRYTGLGRELPGQVAE